MDVSLFLRGMDQLGVDFYTGVPDSLLRPLNDTLLARYGLKDAHVVAANEGGAVGLAAGHFIATGKPALVYLQNSGIGNAVNPIASLLHERVYGIPCVFVVGWRGEPGVKDEPQHAFQGIVTHEMLTLLDLTVCELSADTTDAGFQVMLAKARPLLGEGRSFAFLVHQGGLTGGEHPTVENDAPLSREDALRELLEGAGPTDCIVATTGKTSREVFALREAMGQGHDRDFLTVGSMGHAGMIALGMAKCQPKRRFWCLDGDGAALMHLGSLAVEVQQHRVNLIHVLLNNGAHESVGGMPVVGGQYRFAQVASAMGFEGVFSAYSLEDLREQLPRIRRTAQEQLCFLEIILHPGSREDLGRPTRTPRQNMVGLMRTLKEDTLL